MYLFIIDLGKRLWSSFTLFFFFFFFPFKLCWWDTRPRTLSFSFVIGGRFFLFFWLEKFGVLQGRRSFLRILLYSDAAAWKPFFFFGKQFWVLYNIRTILVFQFFEERQKGNVLWDWWVSMCVNSFPSRSVEKKKNKKINTTEWFE